MSNTKNLTLQIWQEKSAPSICDFIFGSMRTSLLTDMVDVDLIIWTVRGIYTYRKDHTAEFIIFTPWSKKVIPFPLLDGKYKLFGMIRDRRGQYHGMMAVHFSSLPLLKHLETQDREPQAKLEPGGWAEIGLTL